MSALLRAFAFILLLGFLFVPPCFGASDDVCGCSLFGARLVLAAKEAIRTSGGKGKLKAQYFDISCPVDGIQVFAGTTYGNAALSVIDQNEHRLVLTAKDSKHYVVATMTPKALDVAKKSRKLRKQAKSLPKNSGERLALEQEIADIFAWLGTAPTSEIVTLVTGQGN